MSWTLGHVPSSQCTLLERGQCLTLGKANREGERGANADAGNTVTAARKHTKLHHLGKEDTMKS
jgi:hypothetical protein